MISMVTFGDFRCFQANLPGEKTMNFGDFGVFSLSLPGEKKMNFGDFRVYFGVYKTRDLGYILSRFRGL